MQSDRREVMGIHPEGRTRYIARRVRPGDALTLRAEPDDPHDPNTLAVYHDGRKIGSIPPENTWVLQSIEKGDRIEATVKELVHGDDGDVSRIDVTVAVVAGGDSDASSARIPEPNPIVAAIGDELAILGAVATATGPFKSTELALIAKYAQVRCSELALSVEAEQIAQSLDWLKRNLPDDQGLASAVGRLERADAFEAMLQVSKIIAEADGPVSTGERATVARIHSLIEQRRPLGRFRF